MDYFKRALPVWPAGREMEMNTHCSFTADLPEGELTLRVACGCLYRGSVDGVPFAYGPARAAHGYARVDEWPLPPGKRLELSVAGYCVNSYYTRASPPSSGRRYLPGRKASSPPAGISSAGWNTAGCGGRNGTAFKEGLPRCGT